MSNRARSRPGLIFRGSGNTSNSGGGVVSNAYFTNDANSNRYFTDDALQNKYFTNGGINTPFSPLDLNPLFFSYAPDQSASSMNRSGNDVLSLINRGSAGQTFNAVSPTTTNNPKTGTVNYKGQNLVYFDGADDFLTLNSPNIGTNDLFAEAGKSWTVFVCGTIDVTGYLIAKINGTNVNFRHLAVGCLVAGQIVGICRGTSTILDSNYVAGNMVCVGVRWDGTTLTYWYNGSRIAGTVGVGGNQTTANIQFGARSNGAGFPLTGGLGECEIYGTALSDANIDRINEYYYNTWLNIPVHARFFAIGASNEVRTFIDLGGQRVMRQLIGNQYGKNIIMDVFAVNGQTTADGAGLIDSVLAAMPNKATEDFPTYAWIHLMGNDVTNTRPYSTLTAPQIAQLTADTQYVLNALTVKGYIPILTDISFRHYDYTVIPNVNEQLGSLPYNVNQIRPLEPVGWAYPNGEPYIQLYTIFKNNYLTYLDADGIHFSLALGRPAYRQHIADTVGKIAFLKQLPTQIT